MRVYLAGPIGGCTDEECEGWRNECRSRLPNIEWLSPLDDDYRGKEQGNEWAIVRKDKKLIRECDEVLANCWKPTVGTSMEILYAFEHGVGVIAVCPGEVSPWITCHADEVFSTLDEALEYLAA